MELKNLKNINNLTIMKSAIATAPNEPTLYLDLTQEEIDNLGQLSSDELISEEKKKKIAAINAQRDARLNFNTPQTVSIYAANEDLANLEIEVNDQCLAKWESRVRHLKDLEAAEQENPTLPWIAVDKETYWLNANDYASLIAHLIDRQNIEYIQARKRKNAVLALTSINEILAYDITQVYLD